MVVVMRPFSRPGHTRPGPTRRAVLGLATVAVLSTLLAACSSGPPGPPPASEGLVINRPTPQHVQLQNQLGQHVSLASLRGKYVVMAPFLTLCQDECPLVLAAFISLKRDLDAAGLGHKVVFLEVTVDPGRDTSARLHAYQIEFGADWDLWTGSASAIAAFWKPLGVSYQIVPEAQPAHTDWLTGQPLTYDVTHTDGYFLLNTKGRERFVDASAPFVSRITPKESALLNAGGIQEFEHPQATDWTIPDALGAIGWLTQTNIPGAVS
jgi:protein SCO1